MQVQKNTNVERIIAKLDNDFNIDNTDYIPRVCAWVIDALSILKCTPTEIKKIKLPVRDRIAYSSIPLNLNKLKIYDANGCEIEQLTKDACGCQEEDTDYEWDDDGPNETVDIFGTMAKDTAFFDEEEINVSVTDGIDKDSKALIETVHQYKESVIKNRNYILLNDKQIELTFDTPYIIVEYEGTKSYYSDLYHCELPYIPNNGLLIEAIVYYCMYKILCRGVKHPVFNLAASQYGTNPYYMWVSSQEKVKRSVMRDAQDNILESTDDLWSKSLQLFTFN